MTDSKAREYRLQAHTEGAKLGAFVATLKTLHSQDRETIYRAAVGFVNRLPLDENSLRMKFDIILRDVFTGAAHFALKQAGEPTNETYDWSLERGA